MSRNKSGSWLLGAEGADSSAKRDDWRDMHDTQTYANDFSALGAHISNDDRSFSILMGSLINDQQLIARILGDNGQVKWTGNIIVRSMNRVGDMNGSEQWMVTMAPGDIAVSPAMHGKIVLGGTTAAGLLQKTIQSSGMVAVVQSLTASGKMSLTSGWDRQNSFHFNHVGNNFIYNQLTTDSNCRAYGRHGMGFANQKYFSEHRFANNYNSAMSAIRLGIYNQTHRTTSGYPGIESAYCLLWVTISGGNHTWGAMRWIPGESPNSLSAGVYNPDNPGEVTITLLADFSGVSGSISFLIDGRTWGECGLVSMDSLWSGIDITSQYWWPAVGQFGYTVETSVSSNFKLPSWYYSPPADYVGWVA
jgi:hypothetical protein